MDHSLFRSGQLPHAVHSRVSPYSCIGPVECYAKKLERLLSRSPLSPVKIAASRDDSLHVPRKMCTHIPVSKVPLPRQNWQYSGYPKHSLAGQ